MSQNDPASDAFGEHDIAIVGMAAHLPGAASVAEFWDNLRAGRSAIRTLDEDALIAAGESPARLRRPNYVPAAAMLDGFADFDADFFGFSPKEAAILDPQHRQFMEVAWEAFEDAGHPPENFTGPIGVFSGCGMGSYFYFNICSNPGLVDDVGMFLLRHTGNDKDFLATRVSHIFDLKGPSINIQTACSTSLVAVHYAVQALMTGECDMALAGGVTIELPQGRGYIFKEGEILSPDGECHAFDHRAQGTVFGSGAGAVVLRRLADAVADGDHIWAVIKGSAVNNDGAAKAGYLAPSVDGQAAAIAEAHAVAGVRADSIGYVECHGTGTYLGDPIEVAALTQAFQQTTDARGFCRIGSVKTNIGHTDTAAGVASLIKATLALHHAEMPPSLGYEAPNPSIDFEGSPFLVNDTLTPWTGDGPRRAGVNSLGVGGTNAHAVLQSAPVRAASGDSDWPFQLLTLSAKSRGALDAGTARLAGHLRARPDQPLADVAYTLNQGRRAFERRRVVVAETHAEAAGLLAGDAPRRVFTHTALRDPDVVFMFPGGGAQYAGMARELYATEPVFADWMDRGLDLLQPKLDYDIRALWLPDADAASAATDRLRRPSVQLPLIMITEYALAQLFMSWGVQPAALVGHSMGENTAACLAGVMSYEDCIGLVHLRGQLFDTVPAGGMLSVPLSLEDLRPYLAGDLAGDLDIASVNAPELTVISGPDASLAALGDRLTADGIEAQRVAIDIAAHSRMLDPILVRFGDYLRSILLHAPRLPVISNRTGAELTAAQATDPEYWVQHLRGTVRFADCITTLAQQPDRIYLEMGPGKALASLTRQHGAVPGQQVLSVLRHPDEEIADDLYFIGTLGRIWALGGSFDWGQIWGEAPRHRVPLPTYAFQRSRYFIEPGTAATVSEVPALTRSEDIADWGSRVHWRPRQADCAWDVETELDDAPAQTWLFFADDAGVAQPVMARLRAAGHRVIEVRAGDAFAHRGGDVYTLAPERGRECYDQLIQTLVAEGLTPARIAHFWQVTRRETYRPGSTFFHRNIEQGFYSLMFLAQAIIAENLVGPLHLTVFTSGAAQVRDEALPYPEKAASIGPARVMPHEIAGLTAATVDIDLPPVRRRGEDALTPRLLEELLSEPATLSAAWREGKRFEQTLRPAPLPELVGDTAPEPAPKGAHWVITGGFGGIGLTLAEDLIRTTEARVTLIARSPLPNRDDWADWLADHGPQDATTRRIMAVQRLEAGGGEVHVAGADVCNVEDMRRALATATARFGAPYGLIHAAGHIDDAPILAKTTGAVEEIFAPKIHGLRVIDDLLPDGSLTVMVLFASTSTLSAPVGQIDYVAANEYLNAFAKSRRNGRTRVLALNWGIWADVGMAASALAACTGCGPSVPPVPSRAPLLDLAGFDAGGNRQFTTRLRADQWLLDDHRTKDGTAIVPGTGYLDIVAQALRAHGESGAFEICDLYFFRAMQVAKDIPREMRVSLKRSSEGYDITIRSDVMLRGKRGFVLNAQARLALKVPPTAPLLEVGAIRARCAQGIVEGVGLPSPQEAHLAFGPRWRVLNRMAFGAGEGLADLALPAAFAGDIADGYLLHPALMDLATGWAMGLIDGYQPTHLWVPVSYGRVRKLRPLPARVVSHVRLRQDAEPGFASFDVTIATPEGQVCVEIEKFAIKRLERASDLAQGSAVQATEVEFDTPPGTNLSPAEERLRDTLAMGITPSEGAEAFRRALAVQGQAQLIVSSIDPGALIAQAGLRDTAPASGEAFERPDLDSDYVAPRNDVERTLVGFWQDLLGVAQVGVEDSFFDLGGHSLIAVRLFAKVKKAYQIDFPISVLFEAPTIARCAAMIAERGGISLDDDAPAAGQGAVTANRQVRRFTHLVAMHEGEGGAKCPFFLVAGMFGNVLNLRHLANLLGRDRPFYGLQARGLYGDAEPHSKMEDAARDYIAEMRQVQPHGPYLLGGFSGGGITAYEIARQLEALGEEVALLVMLDTPLPQRPELTRRDRISIKLAEFGRKGPRYILEWARKRIAWEKSRRADAPVDVAPDTFHDTAIEAAFRHALGQYDLAPWDGNLHLFRPPLDHHWKVSDGRWVSRQKEYVFADNDWTRFAPNLSVYEVPGDHDSMVLEPNVRVLAARMRRLMADAEPEITLKQAAE
ncbi:type I polyketide synthase [Roseicitreum antarcticum]|uniref:Acyl transferase domain-containing protein n=1 Tax=Roseicitreum antarcticum TaxID=564137 RepID=A0A1H2RY19_9RHOB|nr:type I polyketide synthase [Roseicitreum antarcticum]SDW24382.1 Acyl transferase domain-containing protein [Roseicitreum antarcticum]